MRILSYVVITVLWLLNTSVLTARDTTLFIGQMPVEDVRGQAEKHLPLQYVIIHANPSGLQQHLVRWFPQNDLQSTSITIKADHYPQAKDPIQDELHRASTFLIDYQEPSIEALTEKITSAYGKTPRAKDLEEFVYNYISDKNYANGFDIASQVAQSQEGDCTEHAVLLAALLRMYDYPARVVTGLYVSLDEPKFAYGHAWTEYYENNKWTGLDATRVSQEVDYQHIPFNVIENETIGYAIELIKLLQTLAIEKIIIRAQTRTTKS